MANIAAIRSVGSSLTSYLDRAYRAAVFPGNRPNCAFEFESIGGLEADADGPGNVAVRVKVLLYRTSMNEHLRTSGRVSFPEMDPPPLSIDLHYLLTFWSASPDHEQLVLAWTLRQLHQTPVLDGSILSQDAAWGVDDVVQLIPEEISNEDLMRIWDTLKPNYRLSFPYIARVVRIDPDEGPVHRPVVATRMNYAIPTGGESS